MVAALIMRVVARVVIVTRVITAVVAVAVVRAGPIWSFVDIHLDKWCVSLCFEAYHSRAAQGRGEKGGGEDCLHLI